MNYSLKTANAAPAVVRIGVALVLLWFGFQQLTDTLTWTGMIPDWATSISGFEASALVMMNGSFEIAAGILLIIGFFTRIVALLSALHLLVITYTVGYGAIGVRDFGLSMAAISTFLYGVDAWCLDRWFQKDVISQNNI